MRPFARCQWPSVLLIVCSSLIGLVAPQNISTSLQIPPLQWINLSQLYKGGSQPIPLRDSVISYDPSKRVLIIYGGESSAGVATQQTYVLELDDLTWRVPVPPAAQQEMPPARSAAVFGQDLASNDRAGILVYGGKGGTGNTPLADLWYYSFQNEFWAEISFTTTANPAGRWGAVGGTAPASSIQNVRTFLWLTGGRDATGPFSYDEVWQLDMVGQIAAGSIAGSGTWSKVATNPGDPNAPKQTRYGLAGTVIPPVGNTDRKGTLVAFGGCDPDSNGVYNATCAQNDANILTLPTSSTQTTAQWTSAADCPPGSYGATLAPNRNTAATTFNSQVFLFPGAIDSTRWSDTSGTQPGEVGILLANSGVWARVLPAGDPTSTPSRPSFKEGAAVYSHSGSITVQNGAWSDTVVFGGRDVGTGQMTNEMWLLRSYNGVIQTSGSGDTASGAGVTVQFLAQCATPITPSTTINPESSTTAAGGPSQTSQAPGGPSKVAAAPLLDGSPVHKLLSPVSVAVFLAAILLLRSASGPFVRPLSNSASVWLAGAGGLIAVGAYAIGIAGFALGVSKGLKDSTSHSSVTRRDTSSTPTPFLSTTHSKVAIILFAILYGLLPIFSAIVYFTRPRPKPQIRHELRRPSLQGERKHTDETMPTTTVGSMPREKSMANSEDDILMSNRTSGRVSFESHVPESDEGDEFPARRRTKSISSGHMFDGLISTYKTRRKSEATLSPPTSYPPSNNKFEVTNRPKRASISSHPPVSSSGAQASHIPRNPSDLDWMERRRSVNMYGQLDYQMNGGGQSPSNLLDVPPPARSSAHEMSPTTPPVPARTPPRLPARMSEIWLNVVLQLVILWALIFWIVTFAILPSTIGLALMVVAAVLYYGALGVLAWKEHPRRSILVVSITRLRGDPTGAPAVGQTPSNTGGFTPVPTASPGRPYLHSPLWRPARHGAGDDDVRSGARSAESEVPEEEDEDDEERQARIEEEMARRDVSIFTVPKRKLVIRN